jgi:hypothetical protein
MVSKMKDVASVANIPLLVAKTRGVGREMLKHIVDFLTLYESSDFPKEKQTEMLNLNADTLKRKVRLRVYLFLRKLLKTMKFQTLNESPFVEIVFILDLLLLLGTP